MVVQQGMVMTIVAGCSVRQEFQSIGGGLEDVLLQDVGDGEELCARVNGPTADVHLIVLIVLMFSSLVLLILVLWVLEREVQRQVLVMVLLDSSSSGCSSGSRGLKLLSMMMVMVA